MLLSPSPPRYPARSSPAIHVANLQPPRVSPLQICDPVEETCCKFATPSNGPVANLRPRRRDLLQICDPVEQTCCKCATPIEQTCCKFATPSNRLVANLRPHRNPCDATRGTAPDATTLLSACLHYAAHPCDAARGDDDDDDAGQSSASRAVDPRDAAGGMVGVVFFG